MIVFYLPFSFQGFFFIEKLIYKKDISEAEEQEMAREKDRISSCFPLEKFKKTNTLQEQFRFACVDDGEKLVCLIRD